MTRAEARARRYIDIAGEWPGGLLGLGALPREDPRRAVWHLWFTVRIG